MLAPTAGTRLASGAMQRENTSGSLPNLSESKAREHDVASQPIDVLEVVTQAINTGDVDAQMAIYEPDAYFNFEQAGQGAITGIPAIREAFTGFLAMKPNITMRLLSCNQAGNIAVIRNAWHLTCTGQDGNPMEMSGQTVVVLRRQSDGNWLVLVDNPYGLD